MDNKINSKMLCLSKIAKELYDSEIEKEAFKCSISKKEADLLLFFSNNPEFGNACDAVVYRGFSKAYVSKAISLLEDKELIRVNYEGDDRRYQHIIVSDKARSIVDRLRNAQRNHFQSIRVGISDEEFAILIKIIDKIANNVLKKKKG